MSYEQYLGIARLTMRYVQTYIHIHTHLHLHTHIRKLLTQVLYTVALHTMSLNFQDLFFPVRHVDQGV